MTVSQSANGGFDRRKKQERSQPSFWAATRHRRRKIDKPCPRCQGRIDGHRGVPVAFEFFKSVCAANQLKLSICSDCNSLLVLDTTEDQLSIASG
jgi:hypothetical protein